MIECHEIAKGTVCYRAKQLIQHERDKSDDLKYERETVKNMGFMTGIFCALHTLYVMDHGVAAKQIIKNNTTIAEMQSYITQHGSEIDADILNWVKKL